MVMADGGAKDDDAEDDGGDDDNDRVRFSGVALSLHGYAVGFTVDVGNLNITST